MAELPTIDFASGADAPAPDKAVASHPQTSGDATADLSHSGATDCPPDEAAASLRHDAGAAVDLIAEIFVGAAKLFDPDPAAYTNQDQAYYDILKQMDDPHAPDLIAIPDGMWGEFDPPPLFLQIAV